MQQAHSSEAKNAVRFETWGFYNLSRDGLPNLGLISMKKVKMVDSELFCDASLVALELVESFH